MLRSNRYSLNDDVIRNLKLHKKELEGPLPSDTGRFEEDFEGVACAGDFYEYFALICGGLDFVLANKQMPARQRKALYKSFFELYPQYAQLKNALTDYPELSREIGRHERVRRLLVSILNKKGRLLT
ncbi:YxiJ family protein [Bacillus velezensis]|uniref:YxiJ family protein n=2 Tax=Bacillus velezensis TaxID=492670 RepID=UPI002DBE6EBE|nr:YxiJ family protein [Bacillus velezensis]MEC1369224.1 YxiJ family protein [Bacillus velezensis]